MTPATAAGARGVEVRAVTRYRVRRKGRAAFLGRDVQSTATILGCHSFGTIICSFLELVHTENLFWACV